VPNSTRDDLAALLLQVEAGLDGELRLTSLAREAGYSPFHFHRLFTRRLGETPAKYVERRRLDRAAYLVAVTEASLIDIGLAVGFGSAETFSRAFRRRFGVPPRDYRQMARVSLKARAEASAGFRGDGCELSEVRFVALKPVQLIAIRRVGPYGEAHLPPFAPHDRYWNTLETWAREVGVSYQREAWGFFPDDPNVTPPDLLRADICLPVDDPVAAPEGDIRSLAFEGGLYAVIEHLGPYDTVSQAYRGCADGIRRSGRYVFREGPPLQVFRKWSIDGDVDLNLSEVAFPVARRR